MTINTRIDDSAQDMAVEALANVYSPDYRMTAVIREYVSNAIDANREAGVGEPVTLDISTFPRTQRERITVTDQGSGMDRETLERVYVHISLSGKRDSESAIGGFGIGAKSAHSLGGTLMVESDTGDVAHRLIAARDTVTGGISNEIVEIPSTRPGTRVTVEYPHLTNPGPVGAFLTLLSLASRVRITGDYRPLHDFSGSGTFRTGGLLGEVASRLGVPEDRLFAAPPGATRSLLPNYDIVSGIPVPTRCSGGRDRNTGSHVRLGEELSSEWLPGLYLSADLSARSYSLPRSREALLDAATGERIADPTTHQVPADDLRPLWDIVERELGDVAQLPINEIQDAVHSGAWTPQDRMVLATIIAAQSFRGAAVVSRSERVEPYRGSSVPVSEECSAMPLYSGTCTVLSRTPRMAAPRVTARVSSKVRSAVSAAVGIDCSPDVLVVDCADDTDRAWAAVTCSLVYPDAPSVVAAPTSASRKSATFTAHRFGGGKETRTIEQWVEALNSGEILGGSSSEFDETAVNIESAYTLDDYTVRARCSFSIGRSGAAYAELPDSLPLYSFYNAPSAVATAYRKHIDQARKVVRATVLSRFGEIPRDAVARTLTHRLPSVLDSSSLIRCAVDSHSLPVWPTPGTRPDNLSELLASTYPGAQLQSASFGVECTAGRHSTIGSYVDSYAGSYVGSHPNLMTTGVTARDLLEEAYHDVRRGDMDPEVARKFLTTVVRDADRGTGLDYDTAYRLVCGIRDGSITPVVSSGLS